LQEDARIEVTVVGYVTDTNEPVELTGTVVAVDYTGSSMGREEPVPLAQLAGRISLTIDVAGETYEIGGWGAVLEEIEATEITVTDVQYD
jgi:hypothetical protein